MRFVAVLASVLILGCGGTESVVLPPIPSPTPTPPQFPNALGTWTGTDTASIRSDIGNSTSTCEMTWNVTEQNAGVFGGYYERRPGDCDRSGAFAARVELDSTVVVTFGGTGTGGTCELISGGTLFRGTMFNGHINARLVQVIQCPTRLGPVQAEVTVVLDMTRR